MQRSSGHDGPGASKRRRLANATADNAPGDNVPALSPEEVAANVLHGIDEGKHQFVCGPAGTGKSRLIKLLVASLRESEIRVQAVAPTGTAALNIHGNTCHRLFGLTPDAQHRPWDEVMQTANNHKVKKRLENLRVLIIDEISMVSAEFLDQMAGIMQTVCQNSNRVFGRCLLVFVGDFSQLPPVQGQKYCMMCGEMRTQLGRDSEWRCEKCDEIVHDEKKWAFNSTTWARCKRDMQSHLLTKNLRQGPDDALAPIIWDMFLGNSLTDAQERTLASRNPTVPGATKLFATTHLADIENGSQYKELDTPEEEYSCNDDFFLSEGHRRTFIAGMGRRDASSGTLLYLKDHRYREKVKLRTGARVLLLANINPAEGLVNGSQGEIVGWNYCSLDELPKSVFYKPISGYRLDQKDVRHARGFVPCLGQGTRASRPSQMGRFCSAAYNAGKPWPIVRFDNGVQIPIYADVSVHELYHDEEVTMFMRTQIPLTLGWASTIHKAQGLTLPKVSVDLQATFESGQEYVALSRAGSLDGLEVRNFGRGLNFGTPDVVKNFYRQTFPQLRQHMR